MSYNTESIAHRLPQLSKLGDDSTKGILYLNAGTRQKGKRVPKADTANWMQSRKQPYLGPLKVLGKGLAFTRVGQETYPATTIGPTPTAEVQRT